jgi:hypothetical protein
VFVPTFVAPGNYNAFLACQTDLGSYAFGPGSFVVTP